MRKAYGSPLITNAAHNRKMAIRAFNGGMTPQQIAAEWPAVWTCNAKGELGQRYDSEYDDGRKETRFMITAESVKQAIARVRVKS